MQNPRLASRYAKSILDLAKEQNKVEVVLSDMQLLNKACQQTPELAQLLKSPLLKADKKFAVIKATFEGKIDSLTLSYIDLLIKKGRESILADTAESYEAQYNEIAEIKTATVTTAFPMDEALRSQILAKIKENLNTEKVLIKTKIDASIIGGFIIEMDGKLFDASIKRDLNDIKHQFVNNIFIPSI